MVEAKSEERQCDNQVHVPWHAGIFFSTDIHNDQSVTNTVPRSYFTCLATASFGPRELQLHRRDDLVAEDAISTVASPVRTPQPTFALGSVIQP
jgi:hypothetical protein